jgi:hypothetical protein
MWWSVNILWETIVGSHLDIVGATALVYDVFKKANVYFK